MAAQPSDAHEYAKVIVSVALLLFAAWALVTDHPNYAGASFIFTIMWNA